MTEIKMDRHDSLAALAKAIKTSKDGDTVLVFSEAQKQLAKRAKARMCPNKDFLIKRMKAEGEKENV